MQEMLRLRNRTPVGASATTSPVAEPAALPDQRAMERVRLDQDGEFFAMNRGYTTSKLSILRPFPTPLTIGFFFTS